MFLQCKQNCALLLRTNDWTNNHSCFDINVSLQCKQNDASLLKIKKPFEAFLGDVQVSTGN
jgi:hypothetical protein